MPIIKPICPTGFILDNTKCRCKKNVTKGITQKKHFSKQMEVQKKTRKRCPNGTRKNKVSGLCESIKKKIPQNKTSLQMINNVSNPIEKDISNRIFRELQTSSEKKSLKDLISSINFTPEIKKSFSPMINNLIISLQPGDYENIFKCGLTLNKVKQGEPIKISIGSKLVKKNGSVISEPICVSSTSKKAKNVLLNNLKRIKSIDCSNIVSPVQKQSNCWFNTMFMVFFISDKGRKFFRYFRQLMIEGTHANGDKIKSTKMKNALFLFNLCIEATIGGNFNSDRKIALTMDTNNIIQYIYDSIPKKYKSQYRNIVDVGNAGNPYKYYEALNSFLNNEEITMKKISRREYVSYIFKNSNNILLDEMPFSIHGMLSMPDILVFPLYDSSNRSDSIMHSNSVKKPLTITFRYNTRSKPIKYVLDSAVVRDNSGAHFSSYITCNSQEKAYDGLSLSRLYDFSWKKLLNKKANWYFKYNPNDDKMEWNFTKGYQLLFYYRVE